MSGKTITTMSEEIISRRVSGLRQVAAGMIDEYEKAAKTGRLGPWRAAMISIIELYSGTDEPKIDLTR